VQWVVKIRLATQTHPGYSGYAVLATKARDKCVSTLGIALSESKDRYHCHQANGIAHPNESSEASLFLSSKNTFKDTIHYLVVIVIGHAPGKVSVRVLLFFVDEPDSRLGRYACTNHALECSLRDFLRCSAESKNGSPA
jgi:hypothetical protein